MKQSRLQHLVALVAVSCSLYCLWRLNKVQTRLDFAEQNAAGAGEVMSGIQLHFAKLYYSAEAKNQALTEFELGEIEENLDRAAQLRPTENNTDLARFVEGFKSQALASMSKASQAGDLTGFKKAYGQAVQSCNACHQATGHPYIVITEPTSPPVSNQHF